MGKLNKAEILTRSAKRFKRVNQHRLDLMRFLQVDAILLLIEDFANVGVGLLCPEIQ